MKRCDFCGIEDEAARLCQNCAHASCEQCRVMMSLSTQKCPQCNGYVGDDQNCRVGGGGCGK